MCECKDADQTPEHILQSCPLWRTQQRDLTWPNGATLAGKLWGSAEELKRIAKFIGDIGLDVRPVVEHKSEEEEVESVVE
jgi:hypothetical protein